LIPIVIYILKLIVRAIEDIVLHLACMKYSTFV
jgi:hypothetical protein